MREIPFQPPELVFAPLAGRPGSLLLDSSDPNHPLSRYSFIAYDPETFLTVAEIRERLNSFSSPDPAPIPFTGGVAGLFGYDLSQSCLGLYRKVIAFDLRGRRAWLCGDAEIPSFTDIPPVVPGPIAFKPMKSRDAYLRDIERVIRYIVDGDIFQANLAQYFSATCPDAFDPYAHYLHLRRINPSPFSAFLNWGDQILASTSPERFLAVAEGKVETRPIKGTLSSDLPAALLSASEKDRAENIMIVDLLRNDLSRVCTDPSVKVADLCRVETFAGLHHLVSTVCGDLRASEDALSALLACFPGGSVTGAPKLRAMEIIAELEPLPRSAYCGSIGYLTPNGRMDTNIAIRTLHYRNGKILYAAGGGITAASDPESEYAETLLKAEKVFASFSS